MEKERINHYTKRLWNAKHTTEIRAILKEFEFECASQNASTSDEALPIADVVKRYLAIGTLGSGKSFRYVDTADTMKCFVEYLNEIYPDFDIDAVIEV